MAVRFTASSQTYQTVPGLGNQSAMTLCGWGRISVDRNDHSTFFAADNNSNASLMLQTTADGVTPLLYDDTTGTSAQLGSALTVGTWYFLALTLSGTTGTMWVRAITATAFTTATLGGLGARSMNRIDWGTNRYTEWLNGGLEAGKAFTAALVEAELWVESLQNEPGRTSGLVGYYPWLGPETVDYSGTAHTLTGGTSATADTGPPIPRRWAVTPSPGIRTGVATIYDKTGGAAAPGAGSGAKTLTPATTHDKTGGAAAAGAGSGAKLVGKDHAKTGGGTCAGAGSGAKSVAHDKTGGAAAAGAGSGAKTHTPATVHAETGGAASSSAGSGAKLVSASYPTTGGAAAVVAGSGAKTFSHPAVHAKTGGASSAGAGKGAKVVSPLDLLPSDVLDLSYWHLTTPADGGGGTAEQIDQPELDDYQSEFFDVDANGMVVCTAPVDGFTTSGASGSTRSELRQRLKGSYNEAAMDPNSADRWQMTITTHADATSISGGSNPRQEMVIAQIHGAGDSPIPLIIAAEFDTAANPRIRIFKNGPGFANPISNYTPDSPVTIRIRIDSGLKLWVVAGQVSDLAPLGSPQYSWPISDFTDDVDWYFKAGSYNKTLISSGSSGQAVARISFLEVLEPADPDEATTHDKTGGAASSAAGSGAKSVVHAKTGGASAPGVGSGARTVIHTKTGGAASAGAGSGARSVVHARTGGAAAAGAGSGAATVTPATVHTTTGGATTAGAASGAREHVRAFTGGAVSTSAGSGARSVLHQRGGGAATLGAGSGSRVLVHDKTGGSSASGGGSGRRGFVRSLSGGATAVGAGSGAGVLDPATTYDKAGGASSAGAGVGSVAVTPSGIDYIVTGGAASTAAGTGAVEVQSAVVHTVTGGAAASAASTGAAEQVPAAVHARTGGAAAAAAGEGAATVLHPTTHTKTGGAAARGAGAGVRVVDSAAAITKTGGGAARGAGIALVEVIHPVSLDKIGGAVAVLAGSGRRRVGGRMRAGPPVAVGQLRAGRPYRVRG